MAAIYKKDREDESGLFDDDVGEKVDYDGSDDELLSCQEIEDFAKKSGQSNA